MLVRLKRFFRNLGPGLVTGASDDDPSGIATYSQAGAQFQFGALWFPLFTLPLMIAVQEMCARIGMVTGKGLVRNLRERYPRPVVLLVVALLAFANSVNIGADLGMMASSAHLIVPIPFPILLIAMTIFTLALQIFLPYKIYAKYLKWLTLSLLTYVLVVLLIRVDWLSVFQKTLVPTVIAHRDYLVMLMALFGTTISPYLFFWQANQEVEEAVAKGRQKSMKSAGTPRLKKSDLAEMRMDVVSGMTVSNVISWFIILTAGIVLYASGVRDISTADEAARVLTPLVNGYASLFFTLGIVGTGLLAVPILSGTVAYAVSEVENFDEGLFLPWTRARGFYGTIMLVTMAGLVVNFLGVSPIKMLIYAAIVNGLVTPPILAAILFLGNDKKLMGKQTNGFWSKLLGWVTVAIMVALPVWWMLLK